jgi:hypothetical protein
MALLTALRFPSFGDTSCCAISASARSHAFTDLLCSPGLFRDFTRKPQGLPSFRKSSIVRLPCSPTPVGLLPQTITRRVMLFLLSARQKLQRWEVFRGSIARLSDSLCTLRSNDYSFPRNTRFRWWVRPYRVGSTHKVLYEGFVMPKSIFCPVTNFLAQTGSPR